MERGIVKANQICDETMQYFFQFVYYIGKECISFNTFFNLFILLVSAKATMVVSLYHDKIWCTNFFGILSIMQKKVLNQIKDMKFYNILIDESTDISMTGHLVIFIMFIEEGMLRCVISGPIAH